MSVRNSMAALEACGLFAAGVVASDGTSTIVGPLEFNADIVTAKTSTGIYTITANPLKGERGTIVTVVCLTSASGVARVDSETYTGDSVVITVKTFAVDGTTAADKAFNFVTFAV